MIKLKELLKKNSFVDEFKAYHASSHDITGTFNIEKIGTGEGSATFGWGFYFAENPDVANSYFSSLSLYKIDGIPLDDYYKLKKFPSNAIELAKRNNITLDKAIEEWNKIYPEIMALDYLITYGDNAEYMLNNKKLYNSVKYIKTLISTGRLKNTSYIYHVDINVDLDELLNWFIPIKEQKLITSNFIYEISKISSLSIDNIQSLTGEKLYYLLIKLFGNKKEASLFLYKHGIKGIKYDDKLSRSTTKKTYNFVIFDSNLIHIKDKQGMPISPTVADEKNLILVAT